MLNRPVKTWKEKRVWIIGGGTGLGAVLARELLHRGAHVAISGRNEENLKEVAGSRGLVVPMDASDEESIQRAMYTILEEWGIIDILIYSAGSHHPARAWELSAKNARSSMDVNFLGVVHVLSHFLPECMERGRGRIVLISSVAGYRGLPGGLLHGPAKAALSNFAHSLYLELKPYKVNVHLVTAGFITASSNLAREYGLPVFVDYKRAVAEILSGMEKGRFAIDFPKRFIWVMKAVSSLPSFLYFPMIRFLTKIHRN